MQARETYTYGNGRVSYLNNQTRDSYQYLTNQSGSVTGLTKDGQAVASSGYHPYGSTKTTTDETGNPFAYNGEARDVTGLDYLRARYYDSQVGTFLTEDSYSGELTDPLSQNLYTYVQNNPVNYTDPSGHRKMGLNVPRRRIINTRNQRKYSQMRVDPALSGHSGIGGGGYLSAATTLPLAHMRQSIAQVRPMLEVIMAEAAPATIRLTSSNKPRLEPSPNANKTSAMPMPKQLASREHRGPKRLKTSTSTGAPPLPQPSDTYVIRRLPKGKTEDKIRNLR